MYRFCGCVVLFNPDDSVINNIKSYINQLEYLYIIDNSPIDHSEWIKQNLRNASYQYYGFKENLGLAFALNYACKKAIKDGFDYILTMDQDSIFENNSVEKLKEYASKTNCLCIGSNIRPV